MGKRISILVVDHDERLLHALERSAEGSPEIELLTASTPEESAALLERNPDIALIDNDLEPSVRGLSIVMRILASSRLKTVPMLWTASHIDPDDQILCREARVFPLFKPLPWPHIVAAARADLLRWSSVGVRPSGVHLAVQALEPVEGDVRVNVHRVQCLLVRRALERSGGNIAAAAKALGVDRRFIDRMLADLPDEERRQWKVRRTAGR